MAAERLVMTRIHSLLDSFARYHQIPSLSAGDELTVGDERDSGGFGRILPVLSVHDQTPHVALLAKEFTPKQGVTSSDIISAVRGLHDALRITPSTNWLTDLLAIPLMIAAVEIAGQQQLVALMLDLKQFGFQPAPFFDPDDIRHYVQTTSIWERIDLAWQYARLAAFLEQLQFTHGDQNPHNLMINQSALKLQLVDFDTGIIAATGVERPLTPGHQDAFMPPEVKGSGVEPLNMANYDLAAERWSVGLMIGQILFGATHPAFFLRAVSAKALEEYAKLGYRWPDIDTTTDLFCAAAQTRYERFRQSLQVLPRPIIDHFGDLFSAGVDGARRPTAASWVSVIDSVRCAPHFTSLTATPNYVLEGTETTLRWSTSQAEWVESPVLGRLPTEGQASIVVNQPTRLTLTAINRWGASERSVSVHVVPLPRLKLVTIPDFPGFNLHASITMPGHPLVDRDPFPTVPSLDRFFSANVNNVGDVGRQIPRLPAIPDFFSADLIPWPDSSNGWWPRDTDNVRS